MKETLREKLEIGKEYYSREPRFPCNPSYA